jgi:hypothetical protein
MLGLYSSSLNGGPLFDDYFYIFENNAVINDVSYWTIFKKFAWPVSISAEKSVFKLWGNEYFYFHFINVLLHFFNSYLLLKLVKKLQIPFPRFIFFLFLLHPSNVISVSWMVQLKTLLCFTFCIGSFFFFLRALDDKRYYALSWASFLLSSLSKSASIPFAVFLLVYSYKKKGKEQLLLMLPFLIISSYSSYRVLGSSITSQANTQYESKAFIGKVHEGKRGNMPLLQLEQRDVGILEKLKVRSDNLLKTSYYYFWQVVLPLDSPPIKGNPVANSGILEVVHMILLLLVIYMSLNGVVSGMSLITGYLMLTPFLGIITAPYMNLSLVSEQHLYLVMPFFICFWVELLTKLKFKFAKHIPILFIFYFSLQTFKATTYYENEINFFVKSLQSDLYNIPVAHNLAVSLVKNNELMKAIAVTGEMIEIANKNSKIKESKYFPNLVILHSQLEDLVRKQP